MRNLKKFLALVLAMMMVMSLMVTVNAAEFKDSDDVTAAYHEAVEVLGALRVYRGKGSNSFDPKGELSRAELATIVYRIITGDVEDALIKQTGGYSDFYDVGEGHWANGYINYVHNGNYMVGVGGGNFNPDGKVNGFQVLATIMRAMGYDKNGEFRGSDWITYTATQARALGLTTGLTTAELNAVATRELVAELLFRAIQKPTVAYTELQGYQEQYWSYNDQTETGTVVRANGLIPVEGIEEMHPYSLGYKNFGLLNDPVKYAQDIFGRPGVIWVYEDNGDGISDYSADDYLDELLGEDINANDSFLVFVEDAPRKVFENVAVNGGDIYSIVKKGADGAVTYTDGNENEGSIDIASGAYDEDQVVGGRGSVVEVYYGGNVEDGGYAIVVINTYVTTIAGYIAESKNKDGVVTQKESITLTPANAGTGEGYGEIEDDEDSYTVVTSKFTKADATNNTVVLYTIANGVVQTVEAATPSTLTVGITRDYGDINEVEGKSYFRAGSSPYYYSVMYGPTEITGEDEDEAAENGYYYGILAERSDGTLNGLGDKVIAYMDKYNNPILIAVIPGVSDETHAMVIYAADAVRTGNRASDKYVLDLDVILNNGSDRSVKALFDEGFAPNVLTDIEDDLLITEPGDAQNVQDAAKAINAEGSVLVAYYIDDDGYYVIYADGEEAAAEGETPDAAGYDNALIQGDANSITGVDVDADTSFIVEERAAKTGKISYKQYAGFKKVNSYVDYGNGDDEKFGDNDLAVYWVETDDGLTVFAQNAVKIDDRIYYEVPTYVYVFDETPEQVYDEDDDTNIAYWVYDVIQDGKVTTIRSKDLLTDIDATGLYALKLFSRSDRIYELIPVDSNEADDLKDAHEFTLAEDGDDQPPEYEAVYKADVIYTDDDVKLNVGDKCVVWDLTGSTPKTVDLDDLDAGDEVVVLYDEEVYVVTVFITAHADD